MTPEREVGRSRHQTADKNRETNSCLHGRHYCQERESASLWCVGASGPQGDLAEGEERGREEEEQRKKGEGIASEAAPTRLGHVEWETGF